MNDVQCEQAQCSLPPRWPSSCPSNTAKLPPVLLPLPGTHPPRTLLLPHPLIAAPSQHPGPALNALSGVRSLLPLSLSQPPSTLTFSRTSPFGVTCALIII